MLWKPDSHTDQLDSLSTIQEEEGQEPESQDTKPTETVPEPEYYDETHTDDTTNDTMIPVPNTDPDIPDTYATSSMREEVGCSSLTS